MGPSTSPPSRANCGRLRDGLMVGFRGLGFRVQGLGFRVVVESVR